jgi:hypothetical protein
MSTRTTLSRRWYGPVRTGLVGPNIVTSGRPSAAAMCIGPLSLAMTRSARSSSATSWRNVVRPVTSMPPMSGATVFSYAPPATTVVNPKRSASGCRSAAKWAAGQRLVTQFVPGNSTA